MDLPQAWSEEAYAAMLRKLRKRFGEGDLIYETAAERWMEMRRRAGPPPGTAGELVGLCLKYVEERALDLLRKQGRLRQSWAPLEQVADRRDEPGKEEVWALLRAQEACLGRLPAWWRLLLEKYYLEGCSDRVIARVREDLLSEAAAEVVLAPDARRRAIEASRKAVSRERRAALEFLRRLVEAEVARADCPAA